MAETYRLLSSFGWRFDDALVVIGGALDYTGGWAGFRWDPLLVRAVVVRWEIDGRIGQTSGGADRPWRDDRGGASGGFGGGGEGE